MQLSTLVRQASEHGASDLHLEGGLPVTHRIRGVLKSHGEPIAPAALMAMARELLGAEYPAFLDRGSADVARLVDGHRCRINVLRSARGVGFAVRLLSTSQVTLKSLNLHPDLVRLVQPSHGLVIVCGPTGAGKTSTLAALLQEINVREARHIITIESPIEYSLTPRRSFIRQREVGRDTPSFAQALVDALREDPDVLMVGELREPEVMRLTLQAAETGHLVLATLHSATVSEALSRLVSAFAPEAQQAVMAQLADVLVGVVAQRLTLRDGPGLVVPECEVLIGSTAARAMVRAGQFFKLGSVIETSASDGSFSFARYVEWLSRRNEWALPASRSESNTAESDVQVPSLPPVRSAQVPTPAARKAKPTRAIEHDDGSLELSTDADEDPLAVLAELERSEGQD